MTHNIKQRLPPALFHLIYCVSRIALAVRLFEVVRQESVREGEYKVRQEGLVRLGKLKYKVNKSLLS